MRKKTTASTKSKKKSPLAARSTKSKTTKKTVSAKKSAAPARRKTSAKKKTASKSKTTTPKRKAAGKSKRAAAPKKPVKKTSYKMEKTPRKVDAEIIEIIEEQQPPQGIPAPEDVLEPKNGPHHGIPYKPDNHVSQHAISQKAENARGLKKPRGTSTHTYASPGHGRGSSNSDS